MRANPILRTAISLALVVITGWAFVVGAFFGFTNDWYGRGRGE